MGGGVRASSRLSCELEIRSKFVRIRGIETFEVRCEFVGDFAETCPRRRRCGGCLAFVASAACVALCSSLAGVFLSPYGAVGRKNGCGGSSFSYIFVGVSFTRGRALAWLAIGRKNGLFARFVVFPPVESKSLNVASNSCENSVVLDAFCIFLRWLLLVVVKIQQSRFSR